MFGVSSDFCLLFLSLVSLSIVCYFLFVFILRVSNATWTGCLRMRSRHRCSTGCCRHPWRLQKHKKKQPLATEGPARKQRGPAETQICQTARASVPLNSDKVAFRAKTRQTGKVQNTLPIFPEIVPKLPKFFLSFS